MAGTVGALTVAAAVSVASRIPLSSNALRTRVVAALAERLDADVELRELRLRIYPRLHATGEGLTVRFERRHDVPPLVSIDRFTIDADLVGLWRRRVAKVALTGLAINIPPHDDHAAAGVASTTARPAEAAIRVQNQSSEAASAAQSDGADTAMPAPGQSGVTFRARHLPRFEWRIRQVIEIGKRSDEVDLKLQTIKLRCLQVLLTLKGHDGNS